MNRAPAALQATAQQHVIDLLAGYWRAQVVSVFARLGLAEHFRRETRTPRQLADAIGASPHGVARLLRAATSCGLVEAGDDGRYALTAVGAVLREGTAGSLRNYAAAITDAAHWRSWERLDQAIICGEPTVGTALGDALWQHYANDRPAGARFAAAMGELSALVALDLLTLGGLDAFALIIDIGASRARLLSTLLRAAPQAQGIAYDRAEVLADASADAALAGRLDFRAGDFHAAVPGGGDLYLLKQIAHDYDDATVVALLRRIADAAAPGAALWLIEMLLPPAGEGGLSAFVDLDMLVLLGGCERSEAAYAELLDAAGWIHEGSDALRGGFHRLRARRRETQT